MSTPHKFERLRSTLRRCSRSGKPTRTKCRTQRTFRLHPIDVQFPLLPSLRAARSGGPYRRRQVRVLSRSGRNNPGSSGDIRVLIDPEEGSILRILPEGAGNSEGGFLNRAMRVEPGRGGSGGAKAAPDRRTPRYLWHFQFVSIYLCSGQFSSWYFSSSLRNDACTAFRHMPVSVS